MTGQKGEQSTDEQRSAVDGGGGLCSDVRVCVCVAGPACVRACSVPGARVQRLESVLSVRRRRGCRAGRGGRLRAGVETVGPASRLAAVSCTG